MKLKKIISVSLVVAMLGSLVVGCGKKSASSLNAEKKVLTFSFWEPGVSKEIESSLDGIKKEYEAQHPDITIELLSQPVSGYQEWIKAQIVADNIPDIQSNHASELEEQYKAGYIVNISDDFNKPSEYNENAIWKDTFISGTLDQAHGYKSEPSYAVPLFGTGLAMFYNKTMYEKLGLTIPQTWDEFIENCKTIKAANETPIAFMAQKEDAVDWIMWELTGGLAGQKILSDSKLNINGDCSLVANEQYMSINSGYLDFTTNTEYQELAKVVFGYLNTYLQYCPDASGLDESAAKTMFLSGKAAHIHTGSWDIKNFINNEEVNFEVGTFPFPRFTKENSQYAGTGMNTSAVQTIAITSSVTKSEGKKEAAVDFLKYLTSKEVYAKFVNSTYQIPVIKDVKVDPVFEGFMKAGYPPIGLFAAGSKKEGRSFSSLTSAIISGEKVEFNDKTFSDIQKSLNREVSDTIERGEYTPENNFKVDSLSKVGGDFKFDLN